MEGGGAGGGWLRGDPLPPLHPFILENPALYTKYLWFSLKNGKHTVRNLSSARHTLSRIEPVEQNFTELKGKLVSYDI